MADATKRIDLAAPLLSVRRHARLGGVLRLRYGERCDDDATLGVGGVPFGWECRPGHPKSACDPALPESDHEAAGRFSDALSRADSCYTVNCSVASLSEHAGSAASAAPSARGSVMMDRFLLAAKEQCVFRKAGAAAANTRAPTGDSLPRRLPVQHLPASHVQSNHVKHTNVNENDDEEWEAHSTAGFASKRRCGLLPTRCAKSALLLLGPARSMARRRHRGARRFLSDYGSARRETNPLLPRPLNGQHPEVHDAGMVTENLGGGVHKLAAAIRPRVQRCSLRRQAAMDSELDRTVRGLYTGQAGAAVHPKATHLGMLLVLDRADGDAPPKCGRTPTAKATVSGRTPRRLNTVGRSLPSPLSQEKAATSRDNTVLALPSPKTPSESWLSRTLPTVSSRPPATSFLGIHVQQIRKQRDSSPWCSSDQAKVVDQGARTRQIRICDLQK